MVFGKLLAPFKEDRPPNNFSYGMGQMVRQARKEANMRQAELAAKIFRRQAAISEIENGKRYVSSAELLMLSQELRKPILYFFPEKYRRRVNADLTDPEISELVLVAKRLDPQDLERLIVQARALTANKARYRTGR
jgi:transcriptional regulator with XRE-family HTH domain